MPTRYKPELNRQSLSHKAISERIHSELCARGAVILDFVGFYGKFGRPDVPGYTGRQEAAELLNEIAGLLAMALTIRLEAGEKAPRKVIATLKAILKHPHLALCDGTEPE